MIVYLAGFKSIEKVYDKPTKDIYLLSSFWEHKGGKYGDYVTQQRHILDSGAFSAINDKTGKYKNFDWDSYCDKYIAFIKKTNQKLFFELDIDCVVGLPKVEYFRKKIEDGVGIAPIPCWHSNRGFDYFLKCCEEYPYVALGTTMANADGKKIRKNPAILTRFIDEAHKRNCKIHGLGFTDLRKLPYLHFDSVDSTAWLSGRKFARVCTTTTTGIISHVHKNKRLIDPVGISLYNFNQFVNYQKWALLNL